MSFKKTPYQYFKVENLESGKEHKKAVVGNFIMITRYSGTGDEDIQISFDNESFQVIEKGVGIKIPQGEEFSTIRIKQTSGTAQTFSYVITQEEVLYARLVLETSGLTVNASGNDIETLEPFDVDDTAQKAVDADSDCLEVLLENNGDEDCWVGDSSIDPDTKRGKKIESGTSIVLSCSADIYAACATGLETTLSCTKIKRV